MTIRMALLTFGALAAPLLLCGCDSETKTPAPTAATTPAPATPAPTKYDAEAFFATTSYILPQGYAWSADDKQLLLSSDETGIFNVYGLQAAGAAKQALTSSTTDSTFAVSWFPADQRVLFTADRGGNEINHLYVREADGATRDLTPGDKTKADFLGWSADKQHFFVTTNERDAKAFDVYKYAVKGYSRTRVFRNDAAWQIAALSPDDRYLALVKPRTSADSDVYLLDLAAKTRAPKLITKHEGNVSHNVYSFTRDSKQLVFATDEFGEFNQAWAYEIASGARTPLIRADWDISFVAYSDSGRYRVWGVNQDGRTAVHILDSNGGKEISLPDLPPGDLAQVRFSRDESRLALLVSSDTSPSDVYTIDLGAGRSARLTHALNPKIKEADLVETEVVRYASFDGLKIPSILYKPQTASATHKVPALVWVHGGPGGQTSPSYSAVIQYLVNHGYVVLGINNRGSSGYGKTFFAADDRRHGREPLWDCVDAKQYLASLPYVDARRIGIVGGSYGGYMVLAALAFQPDEFDVGVDIFGVANWLRTIESMPVWWEAQRKALYQEMGDPKADREMLHDVSPVFHADKIRKPLLVLQGANDPRVLKAESDDIVAAVKKNGVPVDYIIFADEGHGFTKKKNQIEGYTAMLAFLDKHLKGKSGGTQQ